MTIGMDLEKLKSIRTGNKSVITRLFKKIDEARDGSEIDTDGAITNFEKITKKQTLLEELCEQILELTTTEDTENEIIRVAGIFSHPGNKNQART